MALDAPLALATDARRRVLHAGCGGTTLDGWPDVIETRLDIDPTFSPDVLAPLTDVGEIGPFDVVYASHVIEHLYPHEVGVALREFLRVLEPGGHAVIIVPDLEDVRPTDEVLYEANAGPMCGLDLYYGFRPMIKESLHMAHRSGFVESTLRRALEDAGFSEVVMKRMGTFNLMGVGKKTA